MNFASIMFSLALKCLKTSYLGIVSYAVEYIHTHIMKQLVSGKNSSNYVR